MYSDIYERIREICEQKGTTITAICKKITGNPGNLSTWKKGNIRTDYLIGIAQELHCSIDYLLDVEYQFEDEEKREMMSYMSDLPRDKLKQLYKISQITEGEE